MWSGGDELAAAGADLTPELQYVALLADEHLVLTSDTAAYLARGGCGGRRRPASGDLDRRPGRRGRADRAALSASVYAGDYACSALAMGQADETDQEQAASLVAEAGEVNPVTGSRCRCSRTGGCAW